METEKRKIILFDMDMTLADTSIAKLYGHNYKEAQKHISEFSVYEGIEEVNEQIAGLYPVYVVSGNVGSTVKKVIQHFHLNIPLENVFGYRLGYPKEHVARKKKVMQVALDKILPTCSIPKSDIIYIGDEICDYSICLENEISFVGCVWGNDELLQLSDIKTIVHPKDIIGAINSPS